MQFLCAVLSGWGRLGVKMGAARPHERAGRAKLLEIA
jgi:hypothetical protein